MTYGKREKIGYTLIPCWRGCRYRLIFCIEHLCDLYRIHDIGDLLIFCIEHLHILYRIYDIGDLYRVYDIGDKQHTMMVYITQYLDYQMYFRTRDAPILSAGLRIMGV